MMMLPMIGVFLVVVLLLIGSGGDGGCAVSWLAHQQVVSVASVLRRSFTGYRRQPRLCGDTVSMLSHDKDVTHRLGSTDGRAHGRGRVTGRTTAYRSYEC
uniref:Putative secreted peptide n=1 Tax=Anopheles braziliensis TaxID=58242 RepID=A0A2M3ZNT7_9DIPT